MKQASVSADITDPNGKLQELNACSFCIRDICVIGSSLCNFPDVTLAMFFKKRPMLAESRPESLKFNFPRNISHSIEYRVSLDFLDTSQCKLYFDSNCVLLRAACIILCTK